MTADPLILVTFPAARLCELPESVLRLLAIHAGPLLPVGGVFRFQLPPRVWREQFVPALRAAGLVE